MVKIDLSLQSILPLEPYKLVSFPHGVSNAREIMTTIFVSPISLYILLFTIFYKTVIDIDRSGITTYFYAIMFSYLVMLCLFVIHAILIRYIVGVDHITIPEKLDFNNEKTYINLYRKQWISLLWFSPIYVILHVILSKYLRI
jgi:hypothetical protein